MSTVSLLADGDTDSNLKLYKITIVSTAILKHQVLLANGYADSEFSS